MGIVIFILIYLLKKKLITNENRSFISINMAEVPQVPWEISTAALHVIETFTDAVHGNLIPFGDFNMEDALSQNSLLNKYFCNEKTCYANLKKGIYFHNNREVTAYDIEFSLIKDLFLNAKESFSYTLLEDLIDINKTPIKNIKYISKNLVKYPSGLFKGIEVIDNYNIIFHLKRKNNYFFQRISVGRLPIVPIEEFKEKYTKWKKYPIGFGKYKVIDADFSKYEFVLEKINLNENIPSYVKLFFSKDDIGDIKMLLGGPYRGKKQSDKVIIFPNIYSNAGFLFNYKTKLGVNANFRKAISLALDRDKIAAKAIHKEILPEDQMLPNFGWQKNYRAEIPIQIQNINKAKDILNKVPHHLWKNKILYVPSYWEDVQEINSLPYIQEIKEQLERIGLQVCFQETNIKYDKFNDNDKNVLWWSGFGFASDDPNKNFAHFRKGSYFSNEYPEDPEYEKLYQESTKFITKNSKYTKKLSEYFTENNIMVILFNQRVSFAYNTEKISSLGEQYNGIRFEIWKIKIHY